MREFKVEDVMGIIEHRPPFKSEGDFEYEEHVYRTGHKPNSVWNKRKLIKGIHLDPVLPSDFDDYPNEQRPFQEREDWWGVPFIVSSVFIENDTVKVGFNVRVLDGAAWDRSTNRGSFIDDVDAAISFAKLLKE